MAEYTVVSNWSDERMVADVNKYLGLGWTLCGGVSLARNEHPVTGYITYVYAQALSKPPAAAPAAAAAAVGSPENKMLYSVDAAGQKCYYGVSQCPGIGAATEALMAGHQIYYLYELVGQFLCLQRNEAVFRDWLCLNFPTLKGANLQRCAATIAAYGNM